MNIGSTCVGRVPALQAGFLGWMLNGTVLLCKLRGVAAYARFAIMASRASLYQGFGGEVDRG